MKDVVNQMASKIGKLSSKYNINDVFDDFLTVTFASLSNAVNYNDDTEKEYLKVIGKYTKEEVDIFVDLFAMLTLALEDDIDDYLGALYMKLGISNAYSGQFFTPFHVSMLCAGISFDKDKYDTEQTLNDPCVGAGSMPLAMCKVLQENKVNFQNKLSIEVKDIDMRCVKMAYIQLALIGATAKVIWGDTLLMTENAVYYTPMCKFRSLQLV